MLKRCFHTLLLFPILLGFNGFSQQVAIAPLPSWISINEPSVEATPKSGDAGGFYYLLIEQQEHVRKEESFIHNAYKFLTHQGVGDMADINIDFDPSYQKLIFHKLTIHRDGKKIDHLNKNTIRTIQREQDMDRHIYDGSLTAIINLKDIRVGDVVEYAYSIKGYNPIYNGHVSHWISLNYSLPYEKSIKRLIVPTETKLYFKYKNEAAKPIMDIAGGMTSYTWMANNVPAHIHDDNAPSWYDPYQSVQVTDFKDWSEVVDWSIQHFSLKNDELENLRKRINEKWSTPEVNDEVILEIVRFVQDEIRYLGFEGGLNSHKPHAPVKVFDQRFGDCKDKSLLLASMLQEKGIAAYPMLVNTSTRRYTSDILPSNLAFDHCVVEITLSDKKIYIDPTINNQGGNLRDIYFPDYGNGLVIREGETNLTKLPEAVAGGVQEVDTFSLNSPDDEVDLLIRTTYKGGDADGQRSYFAANSLESIQKQYVTFYGNLYPEIREEQLLKINDDRVNNVLTVEEKYKVAGFWKKTEDENQKQGEFYSLSMENLVNVSKSAQRKSPYRLSHPTSFQHTIYAHLASGWSIKSDEKDIASNAYRYRYEVSAMDNNLRIYHHYITSTDHVPVSDVTKFVNDHQEIMNNLSYAISYGGGATKADGMKWAPIAIGVISACLAILLIRFLYFKYDPMPSNGVTSGQPIGGWLILVAIGLSLTPLRLIYDLFQSMEFFDPQSWSNLWNAGNWVLFSIFFFEYVYNIFLFFFSGLLIVLFFNKRSSIPLLISVSYGATFAVTLLDTLVAVSFDELYSSSELQEAYKDLFKTLVAAAIWIPYFRLSVRVKETFVERIEPTQGSDNTVTYTFRN